jgi:outer membrane protein TolC
VELAKTARDLAQKRVDAEQKKYELGIDQVFFVLAAQTDLTAAESQLVNQTISYRLNQLFLLRALGTLLEERRISIQ